MAVRPSVVIIGLDGADFSLLDPWLEAGELPVIKDLIERGLRSPLRSTPQPVSPPAWTTLMTGCNPGKHGIFFFFRPRPEDYGVEVLNATHCRAGTVWKALNAAGLRVGVIGVPMTYPPEHVDGFQVSGFDAPTTGAPIAWPPESLELLREHLGEAYDHRPLERLEGDLLDWARVSRSVRHRTEAAKVLTAAYRPDVLMVVYSESDALQHYYWRTRRVRLMDGGHIEDALLEAYRLLDSKIGELLAEVAGSKTNVILLSDHGSGPIERELNMDALLFQHGFLKSGHSSAQLKRRLLLAGRRLVRRILGQRLADRLSTRYSGKRKEIAEQLNRARVDFSQSLAFPVDTEGGLRLNLRGREARGCVEPAEREAVERRLTEAVLSLRDPVTGRAVFSAVHRGQDLFPGPCSGEGPDLVAERDYSYALHTTVLQRLEGISQLECEDLWHPDRGPQRAVEGAHRPEGILVVCGPAFARGRVSQTPGVADIAPTLLHVLGLPVPEDMDGRPLVELLSEQKPVRYGPASVPPEVPESQAAYTEQEQAEVEERLRNLGYM